MILKSSGSTKSIRLEKSRVEINSNDKSELDNKNEISDNKIGDNKDNNNKVDNDKISKRENHQKMSKSKKTVSSLGFFTPKARLTFTILR